MFHDITKLMAQALNDLLGEQTRQAHANQRRAEQADGNAALERMRKSTIEALAAMKTRKGWANRERDRIEIGRGQYGEPVYEIIPDAITTEPEAPPRPKT